jgi:hypothetical protein
MVVTTSKPQFESSGENLIVKHREFWHDESGGVNPFELTAYELNPGQQEVFPWLANIASRFEKYKFRRLEVHYHPNCPTSTPGYFAIAIDADPSDQDPTNRSEMLAMEHAVTGPCWTQMRCKFPLGGNRIRYVRVGGYPLNTDPRTSDCGKIYISKGDQVFPSGIGSLWVDYEIELMIPQLHIDPPSMSTNRVLSTPFDNNWITTSQNLSQLDTYATIVSSNIFNVKRAGTYLLTLYAQQEGTTPITLDLTAPTVTNGGSGALRSGIQSTTAGTWSNVLYYLSLAVGSTVTIPFVLTGLFSQTTLRMSSFSDRNILPTLSPTIATIIEERKDILEREKRKLNLTFKEKDLKS